MNVILVKNFLMDLFRFMKMFPAVNDNWGEIIKYSQMIAGKYKNHRLVIHILLGYENYLEEKEKKQNGSNEPKR